MPRVEHIVNSGEIVYDKPYWSQEDAFNAVKQAHEAQKVWRKVPLEKRIAHVERAAQYFESIKEDLARDISCTVGKPIAQSVLEIEVGVAKMRQLCRLAPEVLADDAQEERFSEDGAFRYVVRRVPKGVVDVVAPWNYPHFTALNGIVPAVLAGNTVTLKHETAPAVGDAFEAALGHVNLKELIGDDTKLAKELPETVDHVLVHMQIDNKTADTLMRTCDWIKHRVFTGSVNAGRHMMKVAAERAALDTESHTGGKLRNAFIRLSLELGGSDASYVAADASLDMASNKIINIGRLHNSGQSCCSVKRLFVHQSVFDQFMEQAKAHTAPDKTVVGDPLDSKTTLGPQFGGKKQCDNLVSMVHDALSRVRGVQVLVQGKDATGQLYENADNLKPVSREKMESVLMKQQDRAWFFLPTFLVFRQGMDVDGALSQCTCLREESFGPLLPIVEVQSDNEALSRTASSDFGLTCSVFTQNNDLVEQFMQEADVGTVYVNHCNDVHMGAVWEGVGLSGNGSGSCGTEGFRVLTFTKSMIEAK